jgi:N-acyl-D-amino-acid deacylase
MLYRFYSCSMSYSYGRDYCWVVLLLVSQFLVSNLLAQEQDGSNKQVDVLLRGGTIHRGDGGDPMVGDLAIRDGRILAIAQKIDQPSAVTIDCQGLVVCPGFIDLHTHSDEPIIKRDTRACINYLLQGCTTSVTGNCGSGPVDVESYLKKVDAHGAGTHVIHLLPQGSLRDQVMGKSDRDPTPEEMAKMIELTDRAMQDGAYGMSTGLIYVPGTFSKTRELIEIAKVVAKHGGIYASHIRNEGTSLIESVQEAIQIGREAGSPVHISHFKASGTPNWGTLHLAAKVIDKARAEGARVTADQYPYTASSTSLGATLLPSWGREGGQKELEKRIDDPESRMRLRADIVKSLSSTYRIQLASCNYRRDWIGKTLDQIAAIEKKEVADIVLDIERNGGASVVNFGMNEEDVRMAMKFPWVATASDGGAKVPSGTMPHPRSFGTFPRKIGYYAIAENQISLAQAIRSASGLPAEILGLKDRGTLEVSKFADIAIFEPSSFRDRATYDQPYLTPAGIKYVLVDGKFAVYDGQATGILAGKALRKVDNRVRTSPKNKPSAAESID